MSLAQHSSTSSTWGTPPEWLERVRVTLGGIDLDPASDPDHNCYVQAAQYYTEKENGLLHSWNGRVFLNPPGGRGIPQKFFDKLIQQYCLGNTREAIYLGYSLEQLLWVGRNPWLPDSLVAIPNKRIHFRGAGDSPTHGNFFLLMTTDLRTKFRFRANFGKDCLILATSASMAKPTVGSMHRGQ